MIGKAGVRFILKIESSLNRKKEQNPSLPSLRNTMRNGVDSTARPNLNVTQGLAATAVEFIVGHHEQQSIRAESAKKRKAGHTVRAGFERLKSLKASGQMIAITGEFEVGINTLDEVNRRAAIQQTVKEEEVRIKQETHLKHMTVLNKLQEDKPLESKWTKPDILSALRAVKKQGDRANPKNRDELMTYWKELRSRVPNPIVEQVTEVIIGEERQVVLANENATQPSPVGTSTVTSFNEKVGANEIATTSV